MSKIRIAEMLKRGTVADTDLLICEDDIDTKQTTVKDLKRCLNGDTSDPSEYKFYSSTKVNDLINSLSVELSHLPEADDINVLIERVNTLIKNSSGSASSKDAELVAARGTYSTLVERLDDQQKVYDNRYLKNKHVKFTGSKIDLHKYKTAEIEITPIAVGEQTTITIESANKLILSNPSASGMNKTTTGYQFTYSASAYNYDVPCALEAGDYTLYGNYSFSTGFEKSGFRFKMKFADGSEQYLSFGFASVFRFSIDKPMQSFSIIPNRDLIKNNMVLTISNLMVSEYGDLDTYIIGSKSTVNVSPSSTALIKKSVGYCTLKRSKGQMKVSLIDTSYSTDDILNELEDIRLELNRSLDKCNVLEQPGTYVFADNAEEDSTGLCILSKDYEMTRNNHCSLKVQYTNFTRSGYYPSFTIPLEEPLNLDGKHTISIQFYMDKTLSEYYTDDDGIKIMLSSDYYIANPGANYCFFNIGKNSIVQGWNTIKLDVDKFLPHGAPDMTNITQINIRLYSSDMTNGKTMWINSFIIDQKMTPTILFAFDDFDEDGFDYGYPYLYTRGIPATIFANDKTTLTRDYLSKICDLIYTYDWEIGCNGVNPNKEIMIEDDNPREQYLALRDTRQWLIDNFQDQIISYSAPFGNLRPISMKILRSMGFKIAKSTADNFCSFFGEKDFVVPMHLLSNDQGHGADDICAKIDEIVETGQVLCIYTSGVSRYGNEIQANKISFEKVVEKIESYMEQGRLECMTFQQFYHKCVD